MNDPSKKSPRTFQCKDVLWETFEQMSTELACSVDYLINEAMKTYARQASFGARAGVPSGAPPKVPSSGVVPPPPGAPPIKPPVSPPSRAVPPLPASGVAHVPPPPVSRRVSVAPPPPPPPPGAPRMPLVGSPSGVLAPPSRGVPPPPPKRSAPLPPPRGIPPVVQRQPSGVVPSFPQPPQGYPPSSGYQPHGVPSGAMAPPSVVSAPGAPRQLTVWYRNRAYPVTKDRFVIGRGKQQSDLTIKDPNVSRQHAMVELVNGQYYIVDMGSTNGIEYNGQRIARKLIADNDSYRICDHDLRFSFR